MIGFGLVALLIGFWGLTDIMAAARATAACEVAIFDTSSYWFCAAFGLAVLPMFAMTRSETAHYALTAFLVVFFFAAPYAAWVWLDSTLQMNGAPSALQLDICGS